MDADDVTADRDDDSGDDAPIDDAFEDTPVPDEHGATKQDSGNDIPEDTPDELAEEHSAYGIAAE